MAEEEDYLPFLDIKAWFSTSVSKIYKDIWVLHGGRFVGRDSADFLFSTSADCEDTKLVHKEVPTLVVFHPEWIVCVVRARCHPKDHGCGPYYICPASMRGTQVEALSFNPLHPPPSPIATTTTNKNKASDAHTPIVSHYCFAEQKTGRDVSPTAGEEDEESLHMLSTQHFTTQDFIRLEDCEPVLEPIYDFIPNRNGCQVKRTMRQDKEMCRSREIGSQAVA